jgi:uncharacterized protein (DUF302 family)
MSESLQPVSYAPLPSGAALSRLPFEATLAALREAILAEDLWVIQEIDPRLLLEKGGFAILPARQILFFHPRLVARILGTAPAALVEAPLKVLVMEHPGGDVSLHHPDAREAFGRYPGLGALAEEVGLILARVLGAVRA